MRKFTQDEAITKFKQAHGDRYDYSKVVYKTSKDKVIIECHKHGEFEQSPDHHFVGGGCPKCGRELVVAAVKLSREELMIKFADTHGDRYDYSSTVYEKCGKKITIRCSSHGLFEQTPEAHYSGAGCPMCYKERAGWISADNFLSVVKSVHGDRYDYSLINFTHIDKCETIICKDHGKFKLKLKYHIHNKTGCPKCKLLLDKARTPSFEEFVKLSREVHGDRYEYSRDDYVNMSTKTTIDCKLHGKWKNTPTQHIANKQGCKKCADQRLCNSQEWFLTEAKEKHGDRYDYSLAVYTKRTDKLTIICHHHGTFEQTPHHHVLGAGCPECKHFVSKPEAQWLDSLNIPRECRQIYLNVDGKTCRVDAYDPKTNTVYEFYGDYWHGNPKLYKNGDFNQSANKTYGQLYNDTMKREKLLKEAGYKIVSIWEQDWKRIQKKVA